jgi:TetR/AcrR family transcriptional regulator, transcriptional repressor for nem operon
MPYSKEHKKNIRVKILDSAAKAIRSRGIQNISVPYVMKGAGLTHGGFYAHFNSKEQLVGEVCTFAIDETLSRMHNVASDYKGKDKIFAVIDNYLSPQHRDNIELGCILPAISFEVSNFSEEVRQSFTLEVEKVINLISALAGVNKEISSALLSIMVGTLAIARSVNNHSLSDQLLKSGNEQAKNILQIVKEDEKT